MRTNVLEVENLIRNYRKSVIKESEEDVKVLKGISFQVTEGEFVVPNILANPSAVRSASLQSDFSAKSSMAVWYSPRE